MIIKNTNDIPSTGRQSKKRLTPRLIATIYGIAGGLWILVSDGIVSMVSKDPKVITYVQTYKGWFYIIVTAVMLYWLIRRYGDEHMRAENKLKESEEQYHLLFDSNPHPMWVYDLENLNFLAVNEAAIDHYGYSRDEFLSLTIKDIRPVEDIPALLNTISKGPSGFRHSGIRRHKKKDGTIIWVEIISHEVLFGKVRARLVMASDVTERKKAEEEIRTRAHQQEAVAHLGKRALIGIPTDDLLNEAVVKIAEILDVEYCKVLELNHDRQGFLLRSGVGWKEGLVGKAIVDAGTNSQAGYTLLSKEPVVVEDFQKEARFDGPPLLREHGVVSGMSVIIGGLERPYGVLGAHTSRRRTFSKDDINFLQSVSHVLAEAIARKRSEEEVFQAKQDWEETFNSITDMVTIHDQDWNIIRANKAAEKILGLPLLEKTEDKKCFKYYHGSQKPPENCPSCDCLQSGEPGSFEIFERHLNRFIEIRAIPRFDSNHNLVGLIHVVRDITARKEAEEELTERACQTALGAEVGAALVQNKDLRGLLQLCAESIVNNFGAAFARIWTLNERDNVLELEASAGMYTQINGPHGRVPVGKFKIGMIAREKKPHLTNAVIGDPLISDPEWAVREGMAAFAGLPLVVGDKLVGVMAMFSKKPLKETALTVLASIADEIALGIERKRVEAALRDSEINYRTLVDNALVGVYRSTLDGKFLYVNDAMAWILGCESTEEALSQGALTRYKNPADREPLIEKLKREGKVNNYEVIVPTKTGGSINVLISAALLDDAISGMVLDVTGHKKLEEQFRQAQKIEAIGLLAGGVAHDFNNILSAIIGYAHLTLMKMQEDDPLRHNLELILESSNRATVLTQSLLAFSRKQPVNLAVIDLNEVIKGFSKFLLRLIREDISLKTLHEEENLFVLADRGQIEQVIMNLVTNARDAMPNGGKLLIETKRAALNREFIEAHGYGKEGEYALLSVSDTGIGMDEKTRSRVFEPFFTTKEQGKGTGLGLSMAYGTIKKHEGFITVYSEPENGTIFKIYFPIVRASKKADLKKTGEPVELRGGTETILVAEDDAFLRKLTLAALNEFGYKVIEAIDGAEAVSRFKEHEEEIQLIILDGIMPRMSGKEAFREIKAMNPGIKCIFISGYAEDIFTKDGLPYGSEFILKPIAPSDFLKKIREVLDK